MKNHVVEKLLIRLTAEVAFIRSCHLVSFRQYQSNPVLKKALERSLQIVIQVCIDIALRIVSKLNLGTEETTFAVFQKLIDRKILPKRWEKIAPKMISIRNRLVHEYDVIDDHIVYGIIAKHSRDFLAFKKVVEKHLD